MGKTNGNNKRNRGKDKDAEIFADAEETPDKKQTGDTGKFDDAEEETPGKKSPKRQKIAKEKSDDDIDADNSDEEEDDLGTDAPQQQPQEGASNNTQRRSGLSKFVRRILDPNRKPTGLIEPPQVIPLNDEYLKAFGKREKELDEQLGRSIDIDNDLQEEEGDDKDEGDDDADKEDNSESKRKIKVTNLKYTTTPQALEEECLNFGPVQEVNMIMDDNEPTRNTGRAYVVFETAAAAQAAIEQSLGGDLEGRPVRVSLAEDLPKRGAGGPNQKDARYWQRDISTKCFRCGKIGHIADQCPNAAKASICPLCANIHGENHEMRACPLNRVCFNCGIPGHINRECPKPRGSCPPRQICTICCGSGHTRFQCQRGATNVMGIQDAICLVCGVKGHFMCSQLKWFFGLQQVYCFNCGGTGHVGNQCQRPTLDDLVRNEGWTIKEIERAEEYKLSDEMELERAERQRKEREEDRQRDEQRDQRRDHYREKDRARHRARSAPPNRGRDGDGGGGRDGGGQQEFRFSVDDNSGSNNRRGGGGGGSGGRRRGYR